MNTDSDFVRAIMACPDDETLRLVYADWLEERGDPRAQFLRLLVALPKLLEDRRRLEQLPGRAGVRRARARIHEARGQLGSLRKSIDRGWLAQIDRTRIENCPVRFRFRCPQRWEHLQPTDNARVRFCEVCRKNVHYCASVSEAYHHAARRRCVAIESCAVRNHGDDLSIVGGRRLLGRVRVGVVATPPEEEDDPRAGRRGGY